MLFACLPGSPAQAQVTRTFVSGTGTANSSCSYTEPCRFFTQAVAALPSQGGEIDVLDPGSYGQITITNSVSIVGRGWTTITATPSTAAITVTGGGNVNISGVQLDGGGTGQTGISFTGSGSLTVQDSLIRNFAGNAISINSSFGNVQLTRLVVDGAGGGADGILVSDAFVVTITDCVVSNFIKNGIEDALSENLAIINTTVSNNGYNLDNGEGPGNYSGIFIHNSTFSVGAAISGVTANANGANGIVAEGGGIVLSIFSSNVSNNGGAGVAAQGNAYVVVRDTVANNNAYGFESQSSAALYLAHSVAMGSAAGADVWVNGGKIYSYQDNYIPGTIVGSMTPISLH
jgi:Right handed beta helix region